MDEGSWYDQECEVYTGMSFACEFQPEVIKERAKTVVFQKDNVPKDLIHVWWKYEDSKGNEAVLKESRKAGFSLRWRIENIHDLESERRSLAGRVQTPDFGKDVDKEFFMTSRTNTFTLDLPEDLGQISEESKLFVNLSVNTKVYEGWREAVHFSDGPTFKFYPERKNWQAAEEACVEKGGQLASLVDWKENMVFVNTFNYQVD